MEYLLGFLIMLGFVFSLPCFWKMFERQKDPPINLDLARIEDPDLKQSIENLERLFKDKSEGTDDLKSLIKEYRDHKNLLGKENDQLKKQVYTLEKEINSMQEGFKKTLDQEQKRNYSQSEEIKRLKSKLEEKLEAKTIPVPADKLNTEMRHMLEDLNQWYFIDSRQLSESKQNDEFQRQMLNIKKYLEDTRRVDLDATEDLNRKLDSLAPLDPDYRPTS